MKLKGREKYFWERTFNIRNVAAIPEFIERITGLDTEHDDEYFFYLTSRVKRINEIRLRCTQVTNEGVRYISRLSHLKKLTLRNHHQLTKECLPYINALTDLEYLDLSKNNIALVDLYLLTDLRHLKQLIVSSDLDEQEVSRELAALRDHFPGCDIVLD